MNEGEYRKKIDFLNGKARIKNKEHLKILERESKGLEVENGILYKRIRGDQRVRIPIQQEVISILYMLQTHPTGGHFGIETTYQKIKERFYWKGMLGDITKYVQNCDNCQRRGKQGEKSYLYPIKVENAFERIGIDFVGPLPRTAKGNKYIIVAIDYLTKWPEAKALKEATAEKTADFIYKEIICRHGCPKIILTDRGTHFNNQMIQELCKNFEIEHKLSSPYHPQTNGLVERFNRTLCETLAKVIEKENQWDNFIEEALFAYRTRKQSVTQNTPFFLTYGREAKLPIDRIFEKEISNQVMNNVDSKHKRQYELINLQEKRREIKSQIENTQRKQKEKFDQRVKKEKVFKIGDKVLLKEAYKDNQKSGKLSQNWKGPYYIHEIYGKGAYRIKTLDGKILKGTQNIRNIKTYYEEFSRDVQN